MKRKIFHTIRAVSVNNKREVVLVVLALLIFIGISLASIGKFSVWHDESYSATLIQSSYGSILEKTALDVHPPLYYLMLKLWSQVVGEGIVALRVFSLICMLGAIVVTWQIVRRLFGPTKATAAMFVMALGPFLVRYGQEMRMYGLAALFASVATLLYIRMSISKVGLIEKIAYGCIVAAGIYTQYFMVFVPLVHVVHAIVTSKGGVAAKASSLKKFLIPGSIAVLLFLPWFPTVLSQYSEVQGAFWIGPVTIETLTSTPQAMLLMQKQSEMIGWGALLSLVSLLVLIVVYRQFYIRHKDTNARLLLISVLLPPLMLFLLSLPPLQPSYQDRYMSFFATIFYSLIGIGILSFKKRNTGVVATCMVAIILGIGQFNQFREGNNHGWSPKPNFTINELLTKVDDDEPIYSTSLWTFFDLHISVKNRAMANKSSLLVSERPTEWKGNWSALYQRDELIETVIADDVTKFWLLDESGESKYNGDELIGYEPVETYTKGYASITEYVKTAP